MDYKLFLDYILLERGLSKNTFLAYKSDLEHFYKYFGTIDVKSQDIYYYLNSIQCSSSTLARKVSSLKNMYKFLISNNLISINPLSNIEKIKIDQKIPKHLDSSEIKKIADTFSITPKGKRDKLVFDFLVYTGARVSEIVNLDCSDIDFSSKLARLRGKGEKYRIIPMSDFLISSTREYIENILPTFCLNSNSNLLFPDLSRNNYWAILQNAANRAGINKKIYPHMLRHSFATIMLENGANIRHVQELLGHSNISTTERYTHTNNSKLKSAYNKVNFS